LKSTFTAEKRAYVRHCRPPGPPSREGGCRLMGLSRLTVYDAPATPIDETELVARMEATCDEFEAHGCRRLGAALARQ
jgi:hypothetical protein